MWICLNLISDFNKGYCLERECQLKFVNGNLEKFVWIIGNIYFKRLWNFNNRNYIVYNKSSVNVIIWNIKLDEYFYSKGNIKQTPAQYFDNNFIQISLKDHFRIY